MLRDLCGVQAARGERALQMQSDHIGCLLSFELVLFERFLSFLTSFRFMQIFVLLQKCPYPGSAGTNQMSPLVYSEQC